MTETNSAMTTSSANTPVITEVRKTGQDYAVDYNDGATTFFTPYNRSPREEMIIALLEAHIAASSRIQSLEAALTKAADSLERASGNVQKWMTVLDVQEAPIKRIMESDISYFQAKAQEARQALGVSHE